jgi:tRNA(Ile2)-agmatinylcytidine synthase
MYVGIDDTDSLQGMCTTYVMTEIIHELTTRGLDLIGYPRLVRLNPMIPWKTRGNGALCARFGLGRGEKIVIGEIQNKPLYSFSRCKEVRISDEIQDAVKCVVEKYSELDDELTNPAFVLSEKKPPRWLYWAAVRRVVDLKEVKNEVLEKIKC